MRKLATIREIAEIKPIPDADRIEVARIDGWEVVVSKKDNFHVGDRVVYVEIDSKMPETPEYEFLKSRKYVVKTIVMRGQVSQGLVMPLSILPVGEYKLGQDVTDVLGIIKYDPQLEEENAVCFGCVFTILNCRNTGSKKILWEGKREWIRAVLVRE